MNNLISVRPIQIDISLFPWPVLFAVHDIWQDHELDENNIGNILVMSSFRLFKCIAVILCLKLFSNTLILSSSFEPVAVIHFLAAIYLGATVEQTFDCLIVQNRQAMRFMWTSIDWIVKDNMVNGLFLCVPLTIRRRGNIPFIWARAETTNTGAEAVKPDPRCSWQDHFRRVGAGVGMKVRSLVMFSNHSSFHRWSAQGAALLLLLSDEPGFTTRGTWDNAAS